MVSTLREQVPPLPSLAAESGVYTGEQAPPLPHLQLRVVFTLREQAPLLPSVAAESGVYTDGSGATFALTLTHTGHQAFRGLILTNWPELVDTLKYVA